MSCLLVRLDIPVLDWWAWLTVLLVGPFDLAKQMRVTRGGEEHEAAIQRVLDAARSAGKKAAIFCMYYVLFAGLALVSNTIF